MVALLVYLYLNGNAFTELFYVADNADMLAAFIMQGPQGVYGFLIELWCQSFDNLYLHLS